MNAINHVAVWVAGIVQFLLGAGWYRWCLHIPLCSRSHASGGLSVRFGCFLGSAESGKVPVISAVSQWRSHRRSFDLLRPVSFLLR